MFLRRMLLVVPAVLGLSGLPMASAMACDARYVSVRTYELRQVHEAVWVTEYDAYGCAHRVQRVVVRTVQVPVTKLVRAY